jgi:uncharacterized protein YecE (DUF72 family)
VSSGPLRIGTSGWQYRDWRGAFYPADVPARSWLGAYAHTFTTCEINNSFYRLPDRETFARWAGAVPTDFRFAVKASRYLTHVKRLQEPREPVERLLGAAAGLGTRLAVVLLQLPPTLRRDDERLVGCLAAFPAGVRVAVEFRHPSWFDESVYARLRDADAALCLTDRASRPTSPLVRTASWCYLRMHAGRARPEPCYGSGALASWIERLIELYGRDVDGFVYFNNDPHACAPRDAKTFRRRAVRAGIDAI